MILQILCLVKEEMCHHFSRQSDLCFCLVYEKMNENHNRMGPEFQRDLGWAILTWASNNLSMSYNH